MSYMFTHIHMCAGPSGRVCVCLCVCLFVWACNQVGVCVCVHLGGGRVVVRFFDVVRFLDVAQHKIRWPNFICWKRRVVNQRWGLWKGWKQPPGMAGAWATLAKT
jgi:hypothetical protein